jgi:aryl-alcohol dehydrogenase-like predicted oxidoreductase
LGGLTWSPLAGGWLTGKIRSGEESTSQRASALRYGYDQSIPENQRKLDLVDQLLKLAAEAGVSLPH